MKKENCKNYELFRQPRTSAIAGLNNIYVSNTMINNALVDIRKKIQSETALKLGFEVPSIVHERIEVEKSKSKIIALLDKTINSDLHKQSLISAVAITENYLLTVQRIILSWYPEKLKLNIEGIPAEKKIDLDLILEAKDLDALLTALIERKLVSIFYESPQRYFQYIEATLSIEIPDEVKNQFIEIKATRDIIVHNAGIVNNVYLIKSGDQARGKEGDVLLIDRKYFDESIRCMKKLTQVVYEQLLEKYGDV